MHKYLITAKAFIPLLPPLGDMPDNQQNIIGAESFIWETGQEEKIKIKFYKLLKKTDSISEEELPKLLNYNIEIYCLAENINDAASRSIFLLEQSLDTSALWSQAASKITEFISIVDLTQIEDVIKNKQGCFEKGLFVKHKIENLKSFPPGRLIFLSDEGAKKIGRNLSWFRKGLTEFSPLYRFTSFYASLSQLGDYLNSFSVYSELTEKDALIKFIEDELKFPKGSFKLWGDLRGKIIHYGNKPDDFQSLNKEAKDNLEDIYKAAYYGIFKFFVDNPPPPSPIIFFDNINKQVIQGTPDIIKDLAAIQKKRNNNYLEILIK